MSTFLRAERAEAPSLRWLILTISVLLVASSGQAALGQPASGRGTAYTADWPSSLRAAGERITTELQLLPKVDTLSLDYRYRAGGEGIDFSFVFAWQPGTTALYQGRIVPFSELPDGIRMTTLEVEAQARVRGRKDVPVRMLVGVDSLALDPHPDVYAFDVEDVPYETVFLDTPADSARAYFEAGVRFANLQVRRIAFAVPRERSGGQSTGQRDPQPRESSSWSIYPPRINIVVAGRFGSHPHYVGGRPPERTEQPRGDTVGRVADEGERSDRGRSGETRSDSDGDDEGRSGSGRKTNSDRGDSDDEDEDEDSLLPAGAVALAAVGAAAIIGGTVGYHGTGRTPLGLMAGWVRPRGGTLLQASINDAVLGDAHGREHLVVKGLGFYDVFDAPIQPALGVGASATAEGRTTTLEPSITPGAALNLGRIVLTGGYDVVQQQVEFGLAINFKYSAQQDQ